MSKVSCRCSSAAKLAIHLRMVLELCADNRVLQGALQLTNSSIFIGIAHLEQCRIIRGMEKGRPYYG